MSAEAEAEAKKVPAKPRRGSVADRISQFQHKAEEEADYRHHVEAIHHTSDKKKYNFANALNHDIDSTRTALEDLVKARSPPTCTFHELFQKTGGLVANINRVLSRLKAAGEISFSDEVEIFFQNDETHPITVSLHPQPPVADNEAPTTEAPKGKGQENQTRKERFSVTSENCFKHDLAPAQGPPSSSSSSKDFILDNMRTANVTTCELCSASIDHVDRCCVNSHVLHLNCIKCAHCGRAPMSALAPSLLASDDSLPPSLKFLCGRQACSMANQ